MVYLFLHHKWLHLEADQDQNMCNLCLQYMEKLKLKIHLEENMKMFVLFRLLQPEPSPCLEHGVVVHSDGQN